MHKVPHETFHRRNDMTAQKKISNDNKATLLFENLMTIKEFLEATRNTYKPLTVYRWIKAGMPHRKIGLKIWLDPKEVMDWHQRRQ
jgi:hypothetical protein